MANIRTTLTTLSHTGRGFSRSVITDSQDYSQRLERDADDAALLIDKHSSNTGAFVIGNSSGAIVSLKLLARHADKIRTLLCYEPPAARFLPDFDDLWATHEDVFATYRAHGMHPALEKFAGLTHTDQRLVRSLMDFERPFLFSNLQYWFEREFMTYPQAQFDVERDFEPVKGKLVLVNGELSPKEAYQYRGNVALAEKLGTEVVLFPGEHVGHATHAGDFAGKFLEVLKERKDV